MAPHQERVIREHEDLAETITRLDSFLLCEVFQSLPIPEKIRLLDQIRYMKGYLGVLKDRIAHFS